MAVSIRLDGNLLEEPTNERVPELAVNIDVSCLKNIAEPVLKLSIRRADGKEARFQVSIAGSENGRCKATLDAIARDEEQDSSVTRTGHFVDWNSVGR